MYSFVSEQEEKVTETMQCLVDSIIELEDVGSITDDDTEECLYYLKKIAQIAGSHLDLDDLNEKFL